MIRDIAAGDELLATSKVPLNIRDICDNSDKETGKSIFFIEMSTSFILYWKRSAGTTYNNWLGLTIFAVNKMSNETAMKNPLHENVKLSCNNHHKLRARARIRLMKRNVAFEAMQPQQYSNESDGIIWNDTRYIERKNTHNIKYDFSAFWHAFDSLYGGNLVKLPLWNSHIDPFALFDGRESLLISSCVMSRSHPFTHLESEQIELTNPLVYGIDATYNNISLLS